MSPPALALDRDPARLRVALLHDENAAMLIQNAQPLKQYLEATLKKDIEFIATAGGPMKSVADIRGKPFTFGDQASTSSHLAPARAPAETGPGRRQGRRYGTRLTGSALRNRIEHDPLVQVL